MNNIISLKNEAITIRKLKAGDEENLLRYLVELSAETKSRFAPHPFDIETVNAICNGSSPAITRYVAIDDKNKIIAYMIVKLGMNEGEIYRLRQNNISFDEKLICTFAPSVADAWQSAGLGSAMYELIEQEIADDCNCQFIILWGGVQATNERAIRFYTKHEYKHLSSFWYGGKYNYDMMKSLRH